MFAADDERKENNNNDDDYDDFKENIYKTSNLVDR